MASIIKRINAYDGAIPATLKKIKRDALKGSPFRFYRGTCHLFAEDFVKLYKSGNKVNSWICGDLHFENFGAYKGENRIVYFDIDDFDESFIAPPETELARFLTSIIIAAGQMNVAAIGLHKTLHDILEVYTTTLQRGKALMLEEKVAHGVFKKYFERLITFNRDTFIDKHTYKQKGALLLKTDNERSFVIDDARKAVIYKGLSQLLNSSPFRHFVFEDVTFRVSGTASLGLERYRVLCYSKKKGKHYLLDVKEARQSCFKGLLKIKQPRFRNEAERITTAGYLMQFNSPAFVSTVKIDNKWFVVKELQLIEDRMSIADFGNEFGMLGDVAVQMAVLMAYAQIRSSGHMGTATADDLKQFAAKKQWQKDIIEVCGTLAKKNNKYYKEFNNAG